MTRLMSPRSALVRRVRAGAVAVGLAVTLAACSAAGPPGAAVVVDGRVVPESDVQTVVRELPPELTGGAPVDPGVVVAILMVEDAVRDVATEFTGVVSNADVQRQLGLETGSAEQLSEPTLRVLATNIMAQQVLQTDGAREELDARIAEQDVQLNPRYGELGEGLQVVPSQPEWLRPAGGQQLLEG
jgi:hypothetical protein